MTKHTPGPWLEDHTAETEVMAQALLDNPSWVAVEDTSENGGHVAYCAPENAPLIAAAPEMHQILTELVEWCRSHTRPTDPNSPHEILVRATAVLDKANTPLS